MNCGIALGCIVPEKRFNKLQLYTKPGISGHLRDAEYLNVQVRECT